MRCCDTDWWGGFCCKGWRRYTTYEMNTLYRLATTRSLCKSAVILLMCKVEPSPASWSARAQSNWKSQSEVQSSIGSRPASLWTLQRKNILPPDAKFCFIWYMQLTTAMHWNRGGNQDSSRTPAQATCTPFIAYLHCSTMHPTLPQTLFSWPWPHLLSILVV